MTDPEDPPREDDKFTGNVEAFPSTDDRRTQNLHDDMRHEYRVLSMTEKAYMVDVKDTGQAMLDLLTDMTSEFPDAGREMALAKTNLEQAVMWAVKGITK